MVVALPGCLSLELVSTAAVTAACSSNSRVRMAAEQTSTVATHVSGEEQHTSTAQSEAASASLQLHEPYGTWADEAVFAFSPRFVEAPPSVDMFIGALQVS